MFETQDEELWADADRLVLPPLESEWRPWQESDDDSWVDELAAADPARELTVAEILHDAEHGAVTSWLASVSLGSLSDDEKIAVAVAAQRLINHCAGVQMAAVAAFAGPEPRDDVSDGAFAWNEVAAALHLGEGAARNLTALARRLRTHLPATLAAMVAGELSWPKMRTLLDASSCMDAEQCAALEERVLPKAGERNPAQHSAAVRYHAERVDPQGWRRRQEQKAADVALIRYHHGDGIADLLLKQITSVEADTMWQAADTWARQNKALGDTRTLDALRCAAWYDWACRYLTGRPSTDGDTQPGNTPPPTRNGAAATVNIFITLPDAIAALNGDTTGVATLAATGEPLPAEAVAELLRTGARIRFALTDHTGRLVGISTKLHDPPALMRAFVALRDVTARTPGGSTAPVAGQDLDHIDPHGPTEPGNLHPPSRGWHRAKTFKHWTVRPNLDGTITWTSRRTGRSYTTEPYDHRAGP